MIFLLDLESVSRTPPFATTTHYFSTDRFSTGSSDKPVSTQYVPALRDALGALSVGRISTGADETNISSSTAIGEGGRATGPTTPKDIAVRIYHEVAGKNRVSALDPRTSNTLGRSAYLRGVGIGGDGTSYTLSSPADVARGVVVNHMRHGHEYDELTIRPSSPAFKINTPSSPLEGYPNGLRFSSTTDEAEITGYTGLPDEFSLLCYALTPRAWDVGSGTMTFAAQRSLSFYMSRTTGLGRQMHISYAHAGGTTSVAGPEFEADERVHFFAVTVDRSGSGVDATFYIDRGEVTTATGADDLVYTSESWKLGRFRGTTAQTADTVLGGWSLFDAALAPKTVKSYSLQRLTGSEDNLVWYYPGEAVGASLLDYASANSASPLDATISGATSAPLFLGTPDLAGTVLPAVHGFQQNVPLTAIDPARKIYRVAGDDVAAITTVVDRQSHYEIEAEYDSPLDFADNPPTASGKVTTCPWMGGLVRIHTEVDGVENSADILGHSSWDNSLVLGNDLTDAHVAWGMTELDPVYTTGEWAFEMWVTLRKKDTDTTADIIAISDYWRMTATPIQGDGEQIRYTVTVTKSDFSTLSLSHDSCVNTTIPFRIEAKNDGGGGSLARLLVAGKVVDTASDGSTELLTAASTFFAPELGRSTSGDGPDLASYLPVRLWSAAGSSDADAESKHQEYLFSNPDPSATDLEGLWYRYSSSTTTLDDETSNGYDGTISSTALWSPGHATDRLSVAKYLLDKTSLTTTFDSTSYDFDPSAIGYFIPGASLNNSGTSPVFNSAPQVGISIAQAASTVLSGGNLYLLLQPGGTALIGLVRDPATATPDATYRVEFTKINQENYEFQPSSVISLYGSNPLVQTSVLAGADASRRAFAESPVRTVTAEVGDNRLVYSDNDPPLDRRITVDTRFVDRAPAQAMAETVAAQWDSVRPNQVFYLVGVDGGRIGGYNDVRPGQVIKAQHPRLPGGEDTVLVLEVLKTPVYDELVVR